MSALRSTGLRASLVVLAAGLVVGAAVGGSLVVLLVPTEAPASLASGPELETVTPSVVQFDDPHEVRVSLTVDAASGLRSPAGGVLTSLSCSPGQQLASGTSSFTVNGAPAVGLATAVPLWRTIAIGDDGTDVSSLENELARLGAAIEPDGQWYWGDARAFDALFAPLGVVTTDDGAVPLESATWLPAPLTAVASCPVGVGSTVDPGAVVAQFAPRVTAARFQPPSEAVEGPRALGLAGGAVPVGPEGTITDPAALTALTGSQEFAEADPQQEPRSIAVPWILTEPVPVTVLPPSALYGISGSRGCVIEDGGPTTVVTVIASQLGRTLVVPERRLGDVLVHPDEDRSCP